MKALLFLYNYLFLNKYASDLVLNNLDYLTLYPQISLRYLLKLNTPESFKTITSLK